MNEERKYLCTNHKIQAIPTQDETTDKQEDSKQKPKPSSSSGASGVMGMFKKSVAYVMDAYKEEYRLMRMSETGAR